MHRGWKRREVRRQDRTPRDPIDIRTTEPIVPPISLATLVTATLIASVAGEGSS